jgi:hypothetical protein
VPDKWFEVDDALSVSPRASRVGRGTALTEEAAPILPCERLHRSRHIVKVCGWATHGIWCNCPFVAEPTPRYAMVTNLNVPHVLPIKPKKSNKIEQEERDKIYGVPAVKVSKFGFPVDGIAYSARQIEAIMRQTLEVEADKMNTIEEEEPHQAGPGPAADHAGLRDRAALGPVLQDHQPCQDEELHHAAPGPGGDDQPVPQNQQPSNITCTVTQTATTAAAVARLVLNPVGNNINVPNSHFATQVQPSHSPRPEPHHQEDEMDRDRESYVHKPRDKTTSGTSSSGVQKVETDGTAGAGQITFGWTK